MRNHYSCDDNSMKTMTNDAYVDDDANKNYDGLIFLCFTAAGTLRSLLLESLLILSEEYDFRRLWLPLSKLD